MSNILLIGGTGFVGTYLTYQLSHQGHRVTVPTRRRERARHLLVGPTVDLVAANIHDDATLAKLMHGQDVVINLAGILRGDFDTVHAKLPARIAAAAKAAGITRLLHMSALGANADAPSAYLRSKAAGEAAVRASGLEWTIFRPSVIFGSGDSFLTMFASLLRIAPLVPLACPDARFQPVWVEDVAAAFAASLADTGSIKHSYDLGGPRTYTLRELVSYAGRITGKSPAIIGLGRGLSWLQALVMECIPGGPMTRDNFHSMQVPSVCPSAATFPFGIQPTPLEAIAPGYLGGDDPVQRCTDFCRTAGR